MTCPFYRNDGRPSCALGEPDGRHCGPRQYPVSPCNLDEIGEWGAWRAFTNIICDVSELLNEPEIFDQVVVEFSDGDVLTNGDLIAFVYWKMFQTGGWSP